MKQLELLFSFVALLIASGRSVIDDGDRKDISSGFFLRCDANKDRNVNLQELRNCMGQHSSRTKHWQGPAMSPEQLISLLDANTDGVVSMQEFVQISKLVGEDAAEEYHTEAKQKMNLEAKQRINNMIYGERLQQQQRDFNDLEEDSSDTVLVEKPDGSTEEIPRKRFLENAEQAMQGMYMKDDKMFKDDADSGKFSEIAKKNPAVGNLIRIAKWAHRQLADNGMTNGSLTNIQSLPIGGTAAERAAQLEGRSIDESEQGVHFSGNFTVWLLLTCTNSTMRQVDQIEVHIHYNKDTYFKPYLGMLDAFLLREDRRRVARLNLPPPNYRTTHLRRIIKYLTSEEIWPYTCLWIAVAVLLLLVSVIIEF